MTRMRPLFRNCARGILVSPSLAQITEGSGSPLTSHVKIASFPTPKMIVSGSCRATGLSEKDEKYYFQQVTDWLNYILKLKKCVVLKIFKIDKMR